MSTGTENPWESPIGLSSSQNVVTFSARARSIRIGKEEERM